ncbi:MAG TPA: alkaline phosphatase family protein [Planctomycetota bacterium]|nr:alkaline phosphatase family protein [Planctomycetota bacterium]
MKALREGTQELREELRERVRALRERRWERLFGFRRRTSMPEKPRGFAIVQVDALAGWVLEEAMRRRRARFLRSLLRRGGFRLRRFRAGLPATTPAFQAGLLYGDRGEIPGFRWLERGNGSTVWFAHPSDCVRIERELDGRAGLLAGGGSSYFSIFTGGADNRLFNTGGLRWEKGRRRRTLVNLANLAFFFALAAARILGRTALEMLRDLLDIAGGLVARRPKRRWGQFVLRALSNALLNELAVIGVREEVRRGTRALYVNFIGYDKAAHARGAVHPYALWCLREIDRDLRRIYRSLHRRHRKRDYDFFVLSDHGIVPTIPIEDIEGQDFEGLLLAGRIPPGSGTGGEAEESAADLHRSIEVLTGIGRILPPVARFLLRPFQRRLARGRFRSPGALPPEPIPRVALRPTGDFAHLYVVGARAPLVSEELEAVAGGMLRTLERSPYVRFFAMRGADSAVVLGRRGARERLTAVPPGGAPDFGLDAWSLEEIRRVLFMGRSGDVLLFGARSAEGAYNFQREYASHGGLEPEEQDCFLLHPSEAGLPGFELSAEALHRFFAERYLGRSSAAPARSKTLAG